MTEEQIQNDKLTTEHELYISIGLKVPVKPSTFREDIDTLLFENIGYMQSWGVHTKDEYIDIIDTLQQQNKQLIEALEEIKDEEWRLAGEFTTIYTTAYYALREVNANEK